MEDKEKTDSEPEIEFNKEENEQYLSNLMEESSIAGLDTYKSALESIQKQDFSAADKQLKQWLKAIKDENSEKSEIYLLVLDKLAFVNLK